VGVLGVVYRAEHPIAVRVKLRSVGLDETPKGVVVASDGRVEQPSLRRGRTGGRGGHPSGD